MSIRIPNRISPPIRHSTAFRYRFLSTHGGVYSDTTPYFVLLSCTIGVDAGEV
jgi:hypothetical protein